jgi:hypothetical protein
MSDWHELGTEIDRWPEAFAERPAEERVPLLEALYRAWIDGELAGLAESNDLPEHDRRIGRVLSSLPDSWADVIVIDCVNPTLEQARRWCWGRDWLLLSQDEDLMLMDDDQVGGLLDEAGRGCTKRDYALSIVAHHARDSMHHALWHGAAKFRSRLQEIASWIPAAREAKDGALVAYLERLASYLEPHEVAEAEVVQRVYDLRRCEEERGGQPQVKRDGPNWVARFDHANVTQGVLFVEVATGKMWAEKRTT